MPKSRAAAAHGRMEAPIALLRWLARHALPFVCAGAAAGLVHVGLPAVTGGDLLPAAACALVLAALIAREAWMARRDSPGTGARVLVELRLLVPGALLLQLVAHAARAAGIELGAVLYLFALVAVTFFSRSASVPALAAVLLTEWIASGGPMAAGSAELGRRGATSLFLVFFGAFGIAFLRTEIVRIRAQGRERLEQKLKSISERARDFRLIEAPSSPIAEAVEQPFEPEGEESEETELKSVTAALDEIAAGIDTLLEVARRTMRLHSAVLLWKDDQGEYLKIIGASSSAVLEPSPIPVQYGVTGLVVSQARSLAQCPFSSGSTPIPYYAQQQDVRSFCAVPVVDGGVVRGVLCTDRLTEDPFSGSDREVLETVAVQALRIVGNERLFIHLVKSKKEQSCLYRASTALRAAQGCEEVMRAAFESARSIVGLDFAAATTYDASTGRHRVIEAQGEWVGEVEGLEWKDNGGLVAQSVRMRYPLPYRGLFDPGSQVVFTRRVKLRGARSLLVLPLVAQDRSTGTLVIASRRERAFSSGARQLLQVVADHTALSYQNALMVRRLEELATTDGLTGMFNKRVFSEALARKLLAAQRFGKKLSLIMTDLDKFKSVNDTHGHQAGDQVLRRFSDVVRRCVREVDMPCRYGGEEFGIICEETDGEGAFLLAERIRHEMEREVVELGQVKLSVTCSLGVATFPEHGCEPDDLIRNADDALYEAKHAGRNRVILSACNIARAV